MSATVLGAAVSLRSALASFEPGLLSGADSARLAEELALTEKACAAARLLATARAVDAGAHKDRGYRDGHSWLAHQSGTTANQARQTLETANRLKACPDTKAALLAGDLSLAQAQEITSGPGPRHQEPSAALLPVARHGDPSTLRDQARQHRQAHTDVQDLHRRQHQARFFRHWRDRLGMVCFSGALPPETGLPFLRRVELATGRARRPGPAPPPARGPPPASSGGMAHAADAVAASHQRHRPPQAIGSGRAGDRVRPLRLATRPHPPGRGLPPHRRRTPARGPGQRTGPRRLR